MKNFPEFENIVPNEPEYDSWLWDGTKPRKHEQKKQPDPENKESKKQPDQKPDKQGKGKQGAEKERPKESQIERSKAKTPEQREEDREAIVEKSLQLKRHFENEPLSNDPRLVARVLVAEHILALNEQLEEHNPHRKDVSPEELSIALDYMGSLAEKLENPSIEAAPDIEEAYAALIELTEEALQTTSPEEIVEHAAKTIEAEAAAAPDLHPSTPSSPFSISIPQTASQGYTNQPGTTMPSPSLPPPPSGAAAILITTLAALPMAIINQQKQSPPPPNAPPTPRPQETGGGYYPPYTPEAPVTRPSPARARGIPKRLATPERQNQTPRTLSGAAPIAAIALTAAIVASPERPQKTQQQAASSETPSSHETTSYAAEVAKTAQSIAASPSHLETTHYAHEATPTYTHDHPTHEAPRHTTPPPSHEVVAAYTKKLEHLPLHTLLTMAENVPLGHGRYLRQEFESNQIDKAGLIKVLKARAKGRDFSMEYREQAARFRTIKSSPEFLHTTNNEPSTTDNPTQAEPALRPAPVKPTTPKSTEPKTFMDQVKATASRISSQEDLPSLPQQSQAPWIVAIIIALIILTAILIFMF